MDLNSDTSSDDEAMATAPRRSQRVPVVSCRTPSEIALADAAADHEKQVLEARAVRPGDDRVADGALHVEAIEEELVMATRRSAFKQVTPRSHFAHEALLMLHRGDAEAAAQERQVFFKIAGQRHKVGPSPLRPPDGSEDHAAAAELLGMGARPMTPPMPEEELHSLRPTTRSAVASTDPTHIPRVFGRPPTDEDVVYWKTVGRLDKECSAAIKRMSKPDFVHATEEQRSEAWQALKAITEMRAECPCMKTKEDTLRVLFLMRRMRSKKAELESKGLLASPAPLAIGQPLPTAVAPACTSPRDPYAQQQWHQQQRLNKQRQLPQIPNQLPPPPPPEDDGGNAAGFVRTYVEAVAAHVQAKVPVSLPWYKDDRSYQLSLDYGLAHTQDTEFTFKAYMTFMRGRQPSTFKAAIALALNSKMDPKEVCRTTCGIATHSHRVDAMAYHIRMHRAFTRPVLEAAWEKLPNSDRVDADTDVDHVAVVTGKKPAAKAAAAPAGEAQKLPWRAFPVDSIKSIEAYHEAHAESWAKDAVQGDNTVGMRLAPACVSVFGSLGASNLPQQEAQLKAELAAVQAWMPQKDLGAAQAQEAIALMTSKPPSQRLDEHLQTVHTVQQEEGKETPLETSQRALLHSELLEHVLDEDKAKRKSPTKKAPTPAGWNNWHGGAPPLPKHKPEPLSKGYLFPGINECVMSRDDYAAQVDALRAEAKRQAKPPPTKSRDAACPHPCPTSLRAEDVKKIDTLKANGPPAGATAPTIDLSVDLADFMDIASAETVDGALAVLNAEPEINKRCRNSIEWTPEEDKILLDGYAKHGNKWEKIAESFPGRTGSAANGRYKRLMEREREKAAASTAASAAALALAATKSMPMSEILALLQKHPEFKTQIQEIVSRLWDSEQQKLAAIQRLVQAKRASEPTAADDSDEELERVCAGIHERRRTVVATPAPAPAPSDLWKIGPPPRWHGQVQRGADVDRVNFVEWNKQAKRLFHPSRINPDKVPPRDQLDTSGNPIPDPNEELYEKTSQLPVSERRKRPTEFVYVVIPLFGAKAGDRLCLELNDGFTCDLGSYTHENMQYRITVSNTWPKRKQEHDLVTALPLMNWHLRSCLNEAGVVVERKQWMYSNYGHLAKVKQASLLRAVYDETTKTETCVMVHPPEEVYQVRDTGRVYWPTGVVAPAKGRKDFPTVDVGTLRPSCLAWFKEQIAAQKQEKAKQATGMDVDPTVQAPQPTASVAPPAQQNSLRLGEICADLLNVASGTFDDTVPDPKLPLVLDTTDARAQSCVNKISALYVLGVAMTTKTLAPHQLQIVRGLHEEVRLSKKLNRWSGDTALEAIGVAIGKDKELSVRTRCSAPNSSQLLGRVAYLKTKKREYLDGKAGFVNAGMDARDWPLPMQWIESFWQNLPKQVRISGNFPA